MTDNLLFDIENEKIIQYISIRSMKTDDEKTLSKMNELIDKIKSKIIPKYTYHVFDLNKTQHGIEVVGTSIILNGKLIEKFLIDSNKIVLMAITLGVESERFILRYQKQSLSEGIFADAIASAYIEKACDALQSEIAKNYKIKGRYSCGYGDLPIEIQPTILQTLNTQRTIGLCCNENNIMLPRKSVTAIMGILS